MLNTRATSQGNLPHGTAQRGGWLGRVAWGLGTLALGGAGLLALWWALRHDGMLWIAEANHWIAETFIRDLGYTGVFLLMMIESSFIPFPSEIVIPPAGALARRLPEWSLGKVIAAGTAGSLAGAWINYVLARWAGRPLLLQWIAGPGRWLRINQEHYERAERLFLRHGAFATLLGRLIPGLRQLISLPAGLARMNGIVFSVLTACGAGLWVALLAVAGYRLENDAEMLSATLKTYALWLFGGVVLALGVYVMLRWRSGRHTG